jgi:hypothetical protein
MTRERVEPGIWRRGEAFEITWRDAQGKQRRKTVQGGCQVEVVDHERPVGTPDVVDVVEDQRAVRIGQIDDSLQEALVFEDLPVEVVGLGPARPLKHLLVRPSSADMRVESDPAPGAEAEALTSTASLVEIWDRRSISASSCVWSSTSTSAKTAPISSLIAWRTIGRAALSAVWRTSVADLLAVRRGPLPPHPATA